MSIDPTAAPLFEKAEADSVEMSWDRLRKQEPQCAFGQLGVCCRICAMGPCQVDPFGQGPRYGVCGADADTIAARNFIRMIAAGAAAHSDHGRGVAEIFLEAAKGEAPGYGIKDEQKLLAVALDLGIEIGERSIKEIAIDVGQAAFDMFGSQHGPIAFLKRAPLKRQKIWKDLGVEPRGVDREIVEIMHRTHMGVDQDYENLMLQGTRAALGDGWGGSMLATDLQDILFGTPVPLPSRVNLGILKDDQVNIIIHGHEPLLSEMIVMVAQEKEMLDLAKENGATGINLGGICCTANEILMRHGIPIAGDFLQQEMAIVTGAVDAMVVDVQCIMQSLSDVSSCYHTKLITTNYRAKIPGATHIQFEEHDAVNCARGIVKEAIESFPRRQAKKVRIPSETMDLVAGFSHETINYLLGGTFRASYRPLNDNIMNGKIRGIAGVVGCNNCKQRHGEGHVEMVRHLIKNNVIVL
ncbi:MAG: anaerobic carbon-monoxide dehydrogenase catalytic subunit, partial [Deltaproteobacteria bacterium]|nr:anaerobic carbon-monoxide dehydrogenase catalytic subunit [Deltaproteobacteria bacterium]